MRFCDCGRDTCTICAFGFDPLDRMPLEEQQAAEGWRPKRTYVINLKRRPERLAHALDECHRVGLSPIVFEALDGRSIKRPSGWTSGGGAYGCMLSHVAVLDECLRDGIKSVLILEDDVRFADDFGTRYPEYLQQLPADWQAAFVGGQHLSMPEVVKGNPSILRCGGDKGCHRTHAYIVRGQYIKTLRDLFTASNVHIDHTWGDAQKNHKVYAPVKWLAYQAESVSDINNRDHKERRWEPRNVRDGGAIRPASAIVPQQRKGCVSCGKKAH